MYPNATFSSSVCSINCNHHDKANRYSLFLGALLQVMIFSLLNGMANGMAIMWLRPSTMVPLRSKSSENHPDMFQSPARKAAGAKMP